MRESAQIPLIEAESLGAEPIGSRLELNGGSSVPLYHQLENALRDEIDSGRLSAGDRLENENMLSRRYGVSRVTVRKALGELEQKGYLVRKPGKGTFIREDKLQRRLSAVIGYSDMCRKLGYKPGAKTISISLEDPSADEIAELRIPDGGRMLLIKRIRYANDRPTMLEISRFGEAFDFLFREDLNDASLYDIIRERRGIEFTESEKILEIVFANSDESKFLGISAGYPLLKIESSVLDSTGTYRQLCKQLCIADKFKLIV